MSRWWGGCNSVPRDSQGLCLKMMILRWNKWAIYNFCNNSWFNSYGVGSITCRNLPYIHLKSLNVKTHAEHTNVLCGQHAEHTNVLWSTRWTHKCTVVNMLNTQVYCGQHAEHTNVLWSTFWTHKCTVANMLNTQMYCGQHAEHTNVLCG
jgi:hypothetical protein